MTLDEKPGVFRSWIGCFLVAFTIFVVVLAIVIGFAFMVFKLESWIN